MLFECHIAVWNVLAHTFHYIDSCYGRFGIWEVEMYNLKNI